MVAADFTAAQWRTSSYSSDAGHCVEVALTDHAVGVRDSKAPASGALVLPTRAWRGFLDALR
ncbi:DUF397 domain-containing protein [Haloechinothrix sp. LS1_15]|uniref:DUF397 domain-containing protein n=1 Tax=Haloechinothrix sp. LS1_15 TaxID=2652248 RepID=UPI002948AD36|nr:DUF397 domain-containing protein [Haloechinothrix sp. LS1_15]MDV6010913.1 DUF397 domain-containing protein [Haloechinothrix sp. LS1_15]